MSVPAGPQCLDRRTFLQFALLLAVIALGLSTRTLTSTASTQQQNPAQLVSDTDMFSGPGNQGYTVVAHLPAGTTLQPTGIYAEFVAATATAGDGTQVQGFIAASALASVSPDLPQLGAGDVPWQPVTVLTYFMSARTTFSGTDVTVTNTTDGPFDVMGLTPVSLSGAFRLTFGVHVADASLGSVMLQGMPQPPETQPWWQGIERLDVQSYNGSMLLGFRDGSAAAIQAFVSVPAEAGPPVSLLFHDPQGKTFSVLDTAGNSLINVDVTGLATVQLPDGLFPNRQLWLGASPVAGSTLTITAPTMEQVPTGRFVSAVRRSPSLAVLGAKAGITIGTDFTEWQARDSRYWDTLMGEYSLVVARFSGSLPWTAPGEYDFTVLDSTVDLALQHGMRVRGAHLVFGTYDSGSVPAWLLNASLSRDQYIAIMLQHIDAVMAHFKGRVSEWIVVNESVGRSFGHHSDFWADHIGPDYMAMAFRRARQDDSGGVLILNEDNDQAPTDPGSQAVVNKLYSLVQSLKAQGVPIDGIGMQMHLLLPWNSKVVPNKDQVLSTMRMFGNLGLGIYITEMDVNLHAVAGTQDQRRQYAAGVYRDVLQACLESGVCRSFTTFGISDANSWITCTSPLCVNIPDADPLLFDENYLPKPAYFAVWDVLNATALSGSR